MSGELEVVAVGARTPVGLTAESSAAAVRAGVSRYGEFPFSDPRGEPIVVAADGRLDPAREGPDRLVPMVRSVLDEVAGKLGEGDGRGSRVRVLLALPEARPGFPEADGIAVANAVRTWARAREFEVRVDTVGRGHAGAIRAVEQAVRESGESPDEIFLVVGVDSYHCPQTFMWLEGSRRLAQPGVRGGFAPGEGAGCLALASASLRSRLRLPRLASVRGVGIAMESLLPGSETGSFGVGLSRAVHAAVADLELPREGVDVLYTDINGERYRSEEWGFALLRTPRVWKSTVYEAPGDCWGDVGAAFGALAGVLAVQSFARRYARGPRALVLAGSDGGLRGALLLQDPRVSG